MIKNLYIVIVTGCAILMGYSAVKERVRSIDATIDSRMWREYAEEVTRTVSGRVDVAYKCVEK